MAKMSLAAARVNAKLTQQEAAEKIGVTKKTVWLWENDLSIPKSDKVDAICEAYGLNYDDINFFDQENA